MGNSFDDILVFIFVFVSSHSNPSLLFSIEPIYFQFCEFIIKLFRGGGIADRIGETQHVCRRQVSRGLTIFKYCRVECVGLSNVAEGRR